MLLEFQHLTPPERYKYVSQTVIPRPIAWVSTEQHGIANIAPFSYFSPLSSEPPTLMVSIGHKADGTPKDTLRNLRESKKCVISIIDETHFEAMHQSAQPLTASQSEFETFHIETMHLLEAYPPLPKEIKVAYFCDYLQEVPLKNSSTIPIIVEIKHLYINDTTLTSTHPLQINLNPIGRIGKTYTHCNQRLDVPNTKENK
jgi:flavin reductase (DIM6/NTAB) family NADH-FMN oxidoreductase RutF